MQFGAGRPDHLRHLRGFVRPEIVHDDHVARLKRGNEQLLDVGAQAFAVDRAIKDKRGSQSIMAEGAEEGQRAPVAMGRKGADALAPGPPTPQGRRGARIWDQRIDWKAGCSVGKRSGP